MDTRIALADQGAGFGAAREDWAKVVDAPAFLARLEEVRGLGPWTAQYVAMRALGEPDAFPSSDGALLSRCGGNAGALEGAIAGMAAVAGLCGDVSVVVRVRD